MQCVHMCQVVSAVSDALQSYGLQPARLLCPWNSPILEWVAMPSSRGSFCPRDRTHISSISGTGEKAVLYP